MRTRIVKFLEHPWGAPTLAFVVGLAALPFLVPPWFHAKFDATYYLLGARSLAQGQGYAANGVPILIRPPGLSLLLAPFVAGGPPNFLLLNTVMSVIGVTSAVLLLAFARRRLGLALALAAAVVIWLNPLYQTLSTMTMSDVPGIAFLAGILLLEGAAGAAPSRGRDVALGLLIGAGCLMRTNTLLMLPAIAASRFLGWRLQRERESLPGFLKNRVVLLAAVVLLSILPWLLWSRAHQPEQPSDQVKHYNYFVAMWHRDSGDPQSPEYSAEEILSRPGQNLENLLWTLHTRLASMEARPGDAAVPWIGVALLAAVLVQLVRRREPAELFTVLSVLVIVFYFSYQERLALPVFALSLFSLLAVLRDAARALAWRVAGAAVPLALLAVLFVADFQPHPNWEHFASVDRRRVQQARAYDACLPPDARVAMWRLANEYSVLLDRPMYLMLFAYRRERTVAALERLIDRYRINTVVLDRNMPKPVQEHFSAYPRVQACANDPVFRVRP